MGNYNGNKPRDSAENPKVKKLMGVAMSSETIPGKGKFLIWNFKPYNTFEQDITNMQGQATLLRSLSAKIVP